MISRDKTPEAFARRMIAAADDSDAALRTIRDMGEAIGIPLITVIDDLSSITALVGYRGRNPIFESTLPRRFRETWNRRQYRLHNPVYLACRTESLPFIWRSGDGAWSIPVTLDAAQRRVLDYAASFQMTGGLCVPIHAPRGHVGCINFLDLENRRLEPLLGRWRAALLVTGVCFMRAHVPPFRQDALDGLRHLTKQEIACVTLAARGMTDKEIALEMEVVPGTARFHVENAARKLNARSRTQAVAIAAQLGLIGSVV